MGQIIVSALGKITGLIFAFFILLWLLALSTNLYVSGCEDGALSYFNCKIGSVDVSSWMTNLGWITIWTFSLGSLFGLTWLVAKVVAEPFNESTRDIRNSLLLIVIVIVTAIMAAKIFQVLV